MRWPGIILLLVFALAPSGRAQAPATNAPATAGTEPSRVIEAAGRVEFVLAGQTNWQPATVGATLKPGDRLRTAADSRAAVQFSDRSVMRLGERTTLEIQPPLRGEKRRFRLPGGSLFFFHRGPPADIEFETPLVTGAIRGTEFATFVDAASGATRLALLDGAVELSGAGETLRLNSGEEARAVPGQPPRKTALLEARRVIQWALYYPAVVAVEDLALADADRTALAASRTNYEAGDLLAAHAAALNVPPGGTARELYRAALDLALGQVEAAEQRLASGNANAPAARARRELIAVVRDADSATNATPSVPTSASEWLARSYSEQAAFRLEAALAAARRAVDLAPRSGFALARVAELEFSFGHTRAATELLERALAASPRLAPAHALRGFIALEEYRPHAALVAFDHALALDAALGQAWLGRGLALMRVGQREEALRSLESAAALEPQRSLPRSYLGKAYSAAGRDPLAEKEFRLARQLDPNDPTAWLYSALHLWQANRANEAIRDLEQSIALNDHRALFRSRLLLDQDRGVRSANLAAIYDDAGLPEVAQRAASRAVADDPAGFSGHLFLAQSYRALEDPGGFNLRFETVRESEQLVANLLAPPGAGNLSRFLSQQEHLRFFEPRPFGLSSLTEYGSDGDWRQTASAFGTTRGLSYAVDSLYETRHGQQPNGASARRDFSAQFKQRLTAQDELFAQVGFFNSKSGDVAQLHDPALAKRDFRVTERQEPGAFLGYHRAWSPGSHTLLLLSRVPDSLRLHDGAANVIFLRRTGGGTTNVETPPGFALDFGSDFTLYSAESQHLWQTPRNTLVIGGRWQGGQVESDATLTRAPGAQRITDDHLDESLTRGTLYAYDHWQVVEPLRLIAGVSYDRVEFPRNSDLAPLTRGTADRDLVSPKLGLVYEPWMRGLLRASYTRSLGGLFFDNSVRLEPTQVAGFNQAFRSLIPESVTGLVPGTRFETAGAGFDQSFRSGTYLGIEAEWLTSDGARTVGALHNGGLLPFPDTATSTRQTLDFRERSLSAYAVQLLGDQFSVGARYRLSDAKLRGRFPDLTGTAGIDTQEQDERALLHRIGLTLNWQHPSGFFGQWESLWLHQNNSGYTPALTAEDLWQHNLSLGYRFAHRRAEVRLGVLNLTGADYRLNPLNLHNELPRHRTFVASLRLNF